MRPFTYARPDDPADAVATLAADPDARFLAGGTNLLDHLKLGVVEPSQLVDVSRVTGTAIEDLPDGGLRVGAGVPNSDLAADPRVRERYPAVAAAVLAGASGQLRNMASTGGNLLQRTRCAYFAEPTTPCSKRDLSQGCSAREGWARYHAILGASEHCIATHPSDLAVALVAVDAQVRVLGPDGARTVPIGEFHRLPGEDPTRDTVLGHGDLVTAVDLPAPTPAVVNSTYRKVRDRASYAFALVSAAVALEVRDGAVADVRIALGGVAHKPWRATTAEAALRGRPAVDDEFRAAIAAELEAATPVDGPLGGNAYKIPLVTGTVVSTLRGLAGGTA